VKKPTLDVRIRFGNAAMLTPDDAADALQELVNRLRHEHTEAKELCRDRESGKLRDANGQTVGSWTFAFRQYTTG
jgi:hypothetical protein